MRIVPKLSLALFAGTCAILVVNGVFRVRGEVALFESDRVRDHATMGHALGTTVESVWHESGRKKALETLDKLGHATPGIEVRWREGADEPQLTTKLIAGEHGREWYTYVPVDVDGVRQGGIQMFDRAGGEERFAHSTIVDTIASAIAIAILSAALSLALGQWIVGTPVSELATKARRVGRGDFGRPIALRTRDELSELAHEMNAMSDSLAATLEQLRHADRLATVGKLASGLAHELGTPLNVIQARAAMIASGETTPDETRESARVVVASTERMTKIIRQLLQFARRKSVKKSDQDVAELCRETLDLLSPLAGKRSVTLEMNRIASDCTMPVDPSELQQVVTNLVVNAVQAMTGPGTVKLTLRATNATAPPDGTEASSPRSCLCIEVQDEGRGIPPEELPRIFEPFFTTKDVGEGTGLGLAVSYGIIREHGGWITVDSQVDRGSTFRVYLPRAA